MLRFGILLVFPGIGLAGLSEGVPAVTGAAVGAGVGAAVSHAIRTASRLRARRRTSLELFEEYQSARFAKRQRAVERFMARHRDVDWSPNDPRVLEADDPDLRGHGAVLRFWHLVAVLDREEGLNRTPAQRWPSGELDE